MQRCFNYLKRMRILGKDLLFLKSIPAKILLLRFNSSSRKRDILKTGYDISSKQPKTGISSRKRTIISSKSRNIEIPLKSAEKQPSTTNIMMRSSLVGPTWTITPSMIRGINSLSERVIN